RPGFTRILGGEEGAALREDLVRGALGAGILAGVGYGEGGEEGALAGAAVGAGLGLAGRRILAFLERYNRVRPGYLRIGGRSDLGLPRDVRAALSRFSDAELEQMARRMERAGALDAAETLRAELAWRRAETQRAMRGEGRVRPGRLTEEGTVEPTHGDLSVVGDVVNTWLN